MYPTARKQIIDALDSEDLTTILALRQRIIDGRFDGSSTFDHPSYIQEVSSCGCFYGSLAIEHGAENINQAYEIIAQRWLPNYMNTVGRTPLEEFVHEIFPGHTPENDDNSLELLDEVEAYIHNAYPNALPQ